MTRKFSETYKSEDVWDIFSLSRALVRQIKYYIENEELSEFEKDFLIKCQKTIEELLEKYKSEIEVMDKISQEQINFGFNVMYNNPLYENLPLEEYNKIYETSSQTFRMMKKDFEKIFELENAIHDLITIPLWKKSTTSMEVEVKPGDEFAYIVHSGEHIIYLPGFPNYRKTRNLEGDYISASLLTDTQMAMFRNSQVGLILKPNESIICATGLDSGTNITAVQNIRTVMKFQNGLYIEAGFPGNLLGKESPMATTKIQTPKQMIEETVARQIQRDAFFSNKTEDVNEIVLDESKAEVIGVFFRTNGCEINLRDFERALMMEKLYNVPLKIVNSSIYRKKLGLEPYESEDFLKYLEDIKFWGNMENWKYLINKPEEDRQLIKRYFNEVVVKQEYEPKIREQIEEIFTRMIEYTYNCRPNETDSTNKNKNIIDD